ncbi:Protein of unknown function DUF1677, plant [Dillenia turbinata]|uniref:Uncharacterized protein n=1 Tax=Dillenia turbinata TaxID=194707 RepID=A0AAN8ZLG7_9MAGN
MVQRISSMRLSLDLIPRAVTDITCEMSISKPMDLRVPSKSGASHDVNKVECECCGLFEDCTQANIQRSKAQLYGNNHCIRSGI